ncbi:uncharacterized protein LOC115953027 isoform X1 [Quercus lobata]|uniref:PHD-type domain-containing protein n=1 Tax=Quercus lobata TaxID=97700 RepID=A0A7N2M6Y5_QUELO|nr:uncharacterized protein LOC115953027 isoform X1 [Quercus lobata]
MKRELEEEVKPELGNSSSLGNGTWIGTETQASSSSIEVSENNFNRRLLSKGSVVNGFIVYTRVRKSRFNFPYESYEISDNDRNKRLRGSDELENNVIASVYSRRKDKEVQIVAENGSNCNLGINICKDVQESELEQFPAKGRGREGGIFMVAESSEGKSDFPKKEIRRYSRYSVRPKVEPPPESVVKSPEAAQNGINLDGEATGGLSGLKKQKNKLVLKMSKKIAMNKKLMTVTELFETGFLDGVTVVYMGCNKFQGPGLRGTIMGGGILCSCTSCNGCRIIPPSKFEIHACKTYKRAAQYICLENGKSLLDLLKACRASPLHTLEATIRSIVGSPPEEKSFICRRCKGCFPRSCVGQVGPLCNSCVDLNKSHGIPTHTDGKKVRSSTPVLISKSPRAPPVSISPQDQSQWEASVYISPQNKSNWKLKTKPPKRVYKSKLSKSASACISSKDKRPWKITAKSSKAVLISRPSKIGSMTFPSQTKAQWKITTKDIRLHKLVFEEGGLPDGSEVAYYARGQKLLVGYKKGSGILCCCCNCEVSPSQFESHAGWASRRKPYAYIYTSNGVSLHELAISLSKGRKYSAKDNDNLCIICLDGGNLLLCDGCPRAFHKECASLTTIPRGDWYCTYCQNMFQREKFVEYNENALAAGRVSGIDPIEQISKRCIRIVRNIDAELSGCVLCRGYDFSKSGFGPRTILLCDQCEMEFHVGCLREHKMAFLKELPKGEWFCSMDCTRINSTLQKLLLKGAEKLPDSLLDVIKRKEEERGLQSFNNIDVRWRLLSGKITSPETRFYLSEAVAIFHNCFAPIIDSVSGRDLIPAMVYGRNIRSQEFGGMYCAILMINSSVVSAGLVRVFGREVAELPLVATSNGHHGKGYFQMLFSCIERLLAFLNVKSLVLPAAEEAESIWTDKFGFERMKTEQLTKYRRSCCQMVTFKGTSMLQKMVPQCRVIKPDYESEDAE